jgi:hypothetical protein
MVTYSANYLFDYNSNISFLKLLWAASLLPPGPAGLWTALIGPAGPLSAWAVADIFSQ